MIEKIGWVSCADCGAENEDIAGDDEMGYWCKKCNNWVGVIIRTDNEVKKE